MEHGTTSIYKEGCSLQSDAGQSKPALEEDASALSTSPNNLLEKAMKKVIFAILFMLPVMACAEKKPVQNTSDYTIAVHVQSSEAFLGSGMQQLNVIIAGKHYELEAYANAKVLPVGDYMARISQDKIDPDHEYVRVYELLFADGTTRKYTVVGESE
jgi:hypothetical protein